MTGRLLGELTRSEVKAAAYEGDTYVQEALEQIAALTGDPVAFAARHALLLLKPDAIAAGAPRPAIGWLEDRGFTIVAARRVTLTRLMVRALWYHQWNIASAERRRVGDALISTSDALVLVVSSAGRSLPAPVLLTELKGPTDPSARRPGQLRHLLGGDTYLLNMVHTPDEPADVVRELGIYFSAEDRAELVAEASRARNRGAAARELASELCPSGSERSFDLAEAAGTLVDDVERAAAAPQDAELRAALAQARSDPRASGPLLALAWDRGLEIDAWAQAVVGAKLMPMSVPGAVAIPGVPASAWESR